MGRLRQVLNGLLWALGPLGRRLGSLSEADLLEEASGVLGWAVSSPPVGLSRWLEEADAAPLSRLGRVVIRATALRLLLRRERILSSPSGDRLRRPLVITGLHRTGTTTLQRLMALDPAFSHLPLWMMMADVPRRDSWRQRLEGHALAAFWNLVCPDLWEIHPVGAALPEEEIEPLSADFCSPSLYYRAPLHGFLDWSLRQDHGGSYRLLRRHLCIAQGATTGQRWLLKCPTHLITFDAFLDEMPDADVVVTHRSPVQAVSSFIRLLEVQHAVSTAHPRTPALIARCVDLCARSCETMMAARSQRPAGEARILDLPFQALVADPIAAVRGIYERFGYPYTAAFEARMRAHLAQEARHPPARSPLRLGDYGLQEGAVGERFQDYRARFALT